MKELASNYNLHITIDKSIHIEGLRSDIEVVRESINSMLIPLVQGI